VELTQSLDIVISTKACRLSVDMIETASASAIGMSWALETRFVQAPQELAAAE
jgi:hypothetical protein